MNIKVAYPPNYADIVKAGLKPRHRAVYCYGDTIYNPSGEGIDEHILVHESVHQEQTKAFGGPEKWWKEYLSNPKQRLEWEIEAYARQYAFITQSLNREARRPFLKAVAKDLSSEMYGHIVDAKTAEDLIKEATNKLSTHKTTE